jgi:hypothetical protein
MRAFIDVILYSFALPLSFALLFTAATTEIMNYQHELQQNELKAAANSLADIVVSTPGNSRTGLSKNLTFGIYQKNFPNDLVNRAILASELGLSNDTGVLIQLKPENQDWVNLTGINPKGEQAVSVSRYVLWEGDPAILRVTLFH